MELVCPAGSPAALNVALDNGADAVYLGLRNPTNARAFPGLNFTPETLPAIVQSVHAKHRKVYLALNTFPTSANIQLWYDSIDAAAAAGVDAIIAAEMATLDYAARRHPNTPRHLSVQGSATSHAALRFFYEEFGISRAVLPRVLSIEQVERICEKSPVGIEVFAFGSLCIMVEGRCQLSSFITGESPNCHGVCSPAHHVHWNELQGNRRSVHLGEVLIDEFQPGEPASYPTVCKGRYRVEDEIFYALEEPTSLNTLPLLPRLAAAGVKALKIEGRQRGPAYVGNVTSVWRQAIDTMKRAPENFKPAAEWERALAHVAEGRQTTLGPYHRSWH